jgi:hypothetical protein
LTITGGKAPNDSTPAYLSHGGGVFVQDGASLNLVNSAVVGNKTTNSQALGGGIFYTQQGGGSITNSVITNNSSASYVGGVYLGGSSGQFAPVNVTGSIIAKNTAPNSFGKDVGAEASGRDFTSFGNNRVELNNPTDVGFIAASDYAGSVDYVVTGVADTYDGSSDPVVMSLRDAINLANTNSGTQEIWLPAWTFVLTLQRITAANQIEMNVWEGDLEIGESLTIRGVGTATSVAWRPGAAADKIFELLGDFTSDRIVDGGDYVLYRKQQGLEQPGIASDGDDNGVVDGKDYRDVYLPHFGNTVTLLNVIV